MEKTEIVGDEKSGRGNTDKSRPPQALYWSFTYNGYTMEKTELLVQILKKECDWYVFQEEIAPLTGVEHLQGTLKFSKRKRHSECKKLNREIHWEITRSVSASVAYCQKKESKKEGGKRWCEGIELEEEIETIEPYGWQLDVVKILRNKPDKRKIHWFWEPNGNIGKSELCKYLVVKHDALILSGKSTDMFHQLTKFPGKRKIILFDIPRSSLGYINYAAIEQIKNGLIYSGKYEGTQLVFNSPHVIIFANEPPDESSLSKDRWDIHRI